MRNFVVKHDFNRAATHKSLKDYTRISQQEIMEENWDVNEFGTDKYPTKADTCYEELDYDFYPNKAEEDDGLDYDDLPIKDPKKWESTNTRYW
ncbi:MAG: hypothetical protein [Bacteriophage sp.]|nr:MAG: hypothetical protein [Bacteriophage sp.]